MKRLGLILLPLLLSAIEAQPWFGDCLEFHFLGSYSYSYFDKVQKSSPPLDYTFHANDVYLGLDFSPTPEWSVDGDLQFVDTSKQNFNFRSLALQARYLWADDIIGDRASFATGGSARFTNTDSLRDISCPSHANFDFELNASIGKEIDVSDEWALRMWAFAAIGHANRGSPWIRGIVALETNYDDRHKFAGFVEGINGYGRRTTVFINDFNGYAKLRQKAIDIGIRYGYRIGVFGTLRFSYIRRVLAKSCPEDVNTFLISYLLPFSF